MKKTRPPAIHPGVVQIKDEGRHRWTAAILSGEAVTQETVRVARRLVEAALLARMSHPVEEEGEPFDSFDLALFCELSAPEQAGFDALGFALVPEEEISAEHRERLTVFDSEVRKVGLPSPGALRGLMRLPVVEASGPLQEEVRGASQAARGELKGLVWGQEPGRFSKALVDHLRARVQFDIGPDPSGLSVLEDLVVERSDREVFRMNALVFQALCDFVCVVAQARHGLEVQWGMCAVDPRTGLSPAPIARVRDRQGPWYNQAVGAQVVSVTVPWAEGGHDGRVLPAILQSWVDACVP